MATDVLMPRLSDSMQEGTIVRWLKQAGDEVAIGDELAEVETDKATVACEADAAGTLLEIIVGDGDTIQIGGLIARIGAPGEQPAKGSDAPRPVPAAVPAAPQAATTPAPPAAAPPAVAAGGTGRGATGRVKASPVARRLAGELGVDLAEIVGRGPKQRILKADVLAAANGGSAATSPAADTVAGRTEAAAPAAPPSGAVESAKGEVTREELTRLQQTVAQRMAESKSTQPEFVLNTEVDMEEAVSLRGQLREAAAGSGRPVPSFNDLVVRACALALRDHPRANGAYRDGGFELYGRINIGVAVAAENALLVPVVHDADRLSLGEIARRTRELAEAVRSGTATAPQLAGGTFTVSNLGSFGVTSFTAVLNPPQAGILAVGAITRRPVAQGDEIVLRSRMEISLTCDHRILYGADAAAFLAEIRRLLEQPLELAF
jgi:pyruvate dehydrogenase E2 component (dihydrolipoamide acetyltransferase)